jgi:hypothetical protein
MYFRSLLFAAAVALLNGSAQAQGAGPACGAFTLTGGDKVINVIDQPPEGPSVGDKRVGSRQLVDDSGSVVGEVHFKSTMTAVAADGRGDVLASEYFIRFPDGWLVTSSLYELPDATDTSQRAGNATLLVSGGTGAFENAGGVVTIEAGDPPTYVFGLNCG